MSALRRAVAVAVGLLAVGLAAGLAEAAPVPRTIVALYDSRVEHDLRSSLIHAQVELPLNHLGLVLRYHDVRDGLPEDSDLDGVRGVMSWFHDPDTIDAGTYLEWCHRLLDAGKKLVVFAELGISPSEEVSAEDINALWERLGLRSEGSWVRMTYDLSIDADDPNMVGFERKLEGILPGYPVMTLVDDSTRAHLRVARPGAPETASVLIATNRSGGFVSPGYAVYAPDDETRQWLLNPFEFLRHAFGTDDLPKPDTTTISGRRIFYSHIDGDGWRNLSLVPEYREQTTLSAEVVLEEVLKRYRGLPVSVAPVVGDLDPQWHGSEETVRIARQVLALAHVEAGSHTYSHPLDWGYFDVGPEVSDRRHARMLERKQGSFRIAGGSWLTPVRRWLGDEDAGSGAADDWDPDDSIYDRPRSYEIEPFRLDKEIAGSVAFIERLLPRGKKVELVQWSGNTSPFAAAIEAVRRLGLRNINGGDSRLDVEYPSYAWVSPIGMRVGGQRQIYASNSNENTYTDLWTGQFFGFQHLRSTIENTESPIRVKPFNVYYHMYSGERLASLNAVLANLELAERSELAPITTSRYAAIADGFYSAELERLGDQMWRLRADDAVETIRFDHAAARSVDWVRSRGVVGQRRFQGSLYVAIDTAFPEPVVALSDDTSGAADAPYLIEGRWRVSNLSRRASGFSFDLQGFGAGAMTWRVPADGTFEIRETWRGEEHVQRVRSRGGVLRVSRSRAAIQPVRMSVESVEESAGR